MRPVKLGAKNYLLFGSRGAGQPPAAIFTLAQNCKRQGIPVESYLKHLLEGFPGMSTPKRSPPSPQPESLPPQNRPPPNAWGRGRVCSVYGGQVGGRNRTKTTSRDSHNDWFKEPGHGRTALPVGWLLIQSQEPSPALSKELNCYLPFEILNS